MYLDNINVYVNYLWKNRIYSHCLIQYRQIYRVTILVGTGPNTVFDYENDSDVEDATQLFINPTFGDYEIYGSYNNDYSGTPPNVLVKQNVYCWQNQNSIIVKYTIVNREPNSIDAIIGHELIPEVQDTYLEMIQYSIQVLASNFISVTQK